MANIFEVILVFDTALLTQKNLLNSGRKVHKTVVLTAYELWVTATSLALVMKKTMKKPWKLTMKS